ncbi:unnamed protein product, partial [Polarella glacialis]
LLRATGHFHGSSESMRPPVLKALPAAMDPIRHGRSCRATMLMLILSACLIRAEDAPSSAVAGGSAQAPVRPGRGQLQSKLEEVEEETLDLDTPRGIGAEYEGHLRGETAAEAEAGQELNKESAYPKEGEEAGEREGHELEAVGEEHGK